MANLNKDYQTINALLTLMENLGLVDGVIQSDGNNSVIQASTMPLTIIDGNGNVTVYNLVVVN